MNYDCVVVFHKCANLMPYFRANVCPTLNPKNYLEAEHRYIKERPVRLILLVRYENNNGRLKTFCKIKCPINPFPVKGEFEAPSMNAVKHSLINLGWIETEAIAGFMLK